MTRFDMAVRFAEALLRSGQYGDPQSTFDYAWQLAGLFMQVK